MCNSKMSQYHLPSCEKCQLTLSHASEIKKNVYIDNLFITVLSNLHIMYLVLVAHASVQ